MPEWSSVRSVAEAIRFPIPSGYLGLMVMAPAFGAVLAAMPAENVFHLLQDSDAALDKRGKGGEEDPRTSMIAFASLRAAAFEAISPALSKSDNDRLTDAMGTILWCAMNAPEGKGKMLKTKLSDQLAAEGRGSLITLYDGVKRVGTLVGDSFEVPKQALDMMADRKMTQLSEAVEIVVPGRRI